MQCLWRGVASAAVNEGAVVRAVDACSVLCLQLGESSQFGSFSLSLNSPLTALARAEDRLRAIASGECSQDIDCAALI